MSDERARDESRTVERASEDRPGDDVVGVELDDPFRSHVADAFGFDTEPTTFRELWEQMLATFAANLDRPLSAADLCTTDTSPHRAVVDGESQSFQCVTDAYIFAGLRDSEVTVRTVSPLNEAELTVEFDATGTVTAPDGAVLSVGVKRSADASDGPVTPERMYGQFCPYSKAFASREEYQRWTDARPDVATEVVALDEALALLARLTGRALDSGGQSDRAGQSTRRGSEDEGDCACVAEVNR